MQMRRPGLLVVGFKRYPKGGRALYNQGEMPVQTVKEGTHVAQRGDAHAGPAQARVGRPVRLPSPP
jgi:hypothetical protein